jgi:endonuclease/exonuclease/phosphatase (EEP) superfamily protein YafD
MLESPVPTFDRLLKRFVPAHRFLKTEAMVIHRRHRLPVALNRHSIKVLNWNIAKQNGELDWQREFGRLRDRYHPDIICLQEVQMCANVQQIAPLTDLSWNFAPNFIDAHHHTYAGILTAACTHPLSGQAVLTAHHEPIAQTPKVSLFTEYPLAHTAQTLLIVNAHLINFVELSHFQAQLQTLEARIAEHLGPIIFSGDCNTWSVSRWFLLQQMATRLGLTQTRFSFGDRLKIKRFLLSPPLDYIFYRGLRQHLTMTHVFGEFSSSDHNPMLVEFSVPR